MEKSLSEYGAAIGGDENTPSKRVSVWGRNIQEAEKKLNEEYGKENVRNIWPIEDKPR